MVKPKAVSGKGGTQAATPNNGSPWETVPLSGADRTISHQERSSLFTSRMSDDVQFCCKQLHVGSRTGVQRTAKSVLDAELRSMEVLVDIDSKRNPGNRVDESDAAGSKVHVIVFRLGRPVRRKGIFNAGADGPAPLRLLGFREGGATDGQVGE
jgi:hypothetical protein